MTRLFLFFMFLKAVMVAFAVLARYGHAWAFGLFLIISIIAILVDLLIALVANAADNDMEREAGDV